MAWTAPEVTRVDEPFVGGERAMLDGYLEWQRATLLLKCAGLTGDQLARPEVPPSNLSLLGLVRHMARVERFWFRSQFRGESLDPLYRGEDADFEQADPTTAEADYAALLAACEASRKAVTGASLDDEFTSRRGRRMALRWVYVHMIEEYARHLGHADLLRERVDGVTDS